MKLTLLEIIQDCLNDLDSDNVNDIWDTMESEQIARIAKTTYYEMIARRDYPHLHRLIDLDPSNDTDHPTHLKMATSVQSMGTVSYNKQEHLISGKVKYREIQYKRPEEFLHITNGRDSTKESVEVIKDWSGIDLLIRTDRFPDYYTSFDDEWLVFDSHDFIHDAILQASKVQAFAVVEPTWEMENDFVPDLPSQHFPAYLAETKSACFLALKQMTSQKDEQRSARSQRWLSRKGRKKNSGLNYPNMGRRGKLASSQHRSPLFDKDR